MFIPGAGRHRRRFLRGCGATRFADLRKVAGLLPMLRGMIRARALAILLAALGGFATSTQAGAAPPVSWPPAQGPGLLMAHFGEEHLDDDDGKHILPNVVAEVARFKPVIATTSADKGSNGTPAQLSLIHI